MSREYPDGVEISADETRWGEGGSLKVGEVHLLHNRGYEAVVDFSDENQRVNLLNGVMKFTSKMVGLDSTRRFARAMDLAS